MSLSCSCDDYGESGVTYYNDPEDFSHLKAHRRQRCWSCRTLINLGDLVLEFERFKIPDYEIEMRIYGEDGEIPRSSKYLCESCGDIYFSLTELGFCVNAEDHQPTLLKEYQEYYAYRTT